MSPPPPSEARDWGGMGAGRWGGRGAADQQGVPVWTGFREARARPRRSSGPAVISLRLRRLFDTQDSSPPFRYVRCSDRVPGKKRALLYLETISHCGFPRVAEVGALPVWMLE